MTTYSIPPLLTLLCFLGLAVFTISRGRKNRTNILFFIICILGAFLYIDILFVFNVKSANTALKISRMDHFFIIYLFPVYIHFFHAYLNISRRKWLVYVSYAYAFILMCFTPTPFYIASMHKHYFGFFARGGSLYPFFGMGGLFVTIYILALLYHSIRHEQNNILKNKLKYVFFGFGIMGLMNGLNIFPLLGYSVYPPGNLSFIPLVIFGIGILRHDLLDMGLFIKKGLIYSTLTAFLTGLYALVIMVLNSAFKDINFSNSMLFSILFFFLIAFLIGPLKTFIQAFIDRLFYKGKYDYQKTIKNISRLIVSFLDINEIGNRLTNAVSKALSVDNCALLLNDFPGGDYSHFVTQGKLNETLSARTVRQESSIATYLRTIRRPVVRQHLLEKTKDPGANRILSEMDELHAEIILPLVCKEDINGFVILGEKQSGDLFTKEDIDLLETLSSQTALAVENARAYEKIDDLNKNLEQKVAERTRSLKETLIEKEKTQEQLVQSESLAAIGQLVAGVAHELNNPLTSVKSLIQATIEDLEELTSQQPIDMEMVDDLRFADRELKRAKEIVKSLLDLSRQTQTYTEDVNLNVVVKDALRVLHNQYKNLSSNIIEDYCDDLPEIQGNFANLGQVAINIIQNGIQAVIENSGGIHLLTRFDEKFQQVVFECRDTGPGVNENIRNDIFKPFFTSKEVGEGTGLGLYICHEIIKKHGGTLTLESSDTHGACFMVRLPVKKENIYQGSHN